MDFRSFLACVMLAVFGLGFVLVVQGIIGKELNFTPPWWFKSRTPNYPGMEHPPERHRLRLVLIGLGLMLAAGVFRNARLLIDAVRRGPILSVPTLLPTSGPGRLGALPPTGTSLYSSMTQLKITAFYSDRPESDAEVPFDQTDPGWWPGSISVEMTGPSRAQVHIDSTDGREMVGYIVHGVLSGLTEPTGTATHAANGDRAAAIVEAERTNGPAGRAPGRPPATETASAVR